ncbi:hypothetical protein K7432_016404 [Basidiobolus ranarum]|uniref:Uncharacterized protein n=1 Tax=Basidiobolus ranarum TaxID=34480 RepID=A0ABR2VMF8_9FUNG
MTYISKIFSVSVGALSVLAVTAHTHNAYSSARAHNDYSSAHTSDEYIYRAVEQLKKEGLKSNNV